MRHLVVIFLLMHVSGAVATAAMYICTQPDGEELYRDYAGPNCREIIEKKPKEGGTPPKTPKKLPPVPADSPTTDVKDAPDPVPPALSRRPFEPVKALVPTLNYYGGHGAGYVPKAGEISFDAIAVGYLKGGSGPSITSRMQFDRHAARGLRQAVKTAAKAVGFDQAYLEVHLDMDLPEIYFQSGVPPRISGDSGSGIWAIAIAAVLLSDTLRPEVCMTGAIEADDTIGFVGKVDNKIFGCGKSRYREMVIPFGQKDIDLVSHSLSLGITIVEVRTFAEAYEAVTGKALRKIGQR